MVFQGGRWRGDRNHELIELPSHFSDFSSLFKRFGRGNVLMASATSATIFGIHTARSRLQSQVQQIQKMKTNNSPNADITSKLSEKSVVSAKSQQAL